MKRPVRNKLGGNRKTCLVMLLGFQMGNGVDAGGWDRRGAVLESGSLSDAAALLF